MFMSAFGHADWTHVIFNVIFFAAFAAGVEDNAAHAPLGHCLDGRPQRWALPDHHVCWVSREDRLQLRPDGLVRNTYGERSVMGS